MINCILVIYALYILCGFLYYLNILSFLKEYKDLKNYYKHRILLVAILPFYQLIAFVIRFAGIINSTTRQSSWKTLTLSDEIKLFFGTISKDFGFILSFRRFLKKVIEVDRDEKT